MKQKKGRKQINGKKRRRKEKLLRRELASLQLDLDQLELPHLCGSRFACLAQKELATCQLSRNGKEKEKRNQRKNVTERERKQGKNG